jgi:hypothetical protein
VKRGTPKRLGKSICVFEENQKQAQDEKFLGLSLPNKQLRYSIYLN